jgi:hypothetical protein
MTINIDNGFISDQNGKACSRYGKKEQILTAMLAAESKNIVPINKAINRIEISPEIADNDIFLQEFRIYYWFDILESKAIKIYPEIKPISCGTLRIDIIDRQYKEPHRFGLFLIPISNNVIGDNFDLFPLNEEITKLMGFLHSRFMFDDFYQHFARQTATPEFMDFSVVEKQWHCEW